MTVSRAALEEHREYLADCVRLGAFQRAIEEIVKPGDVVLDLGAGTGILGLLACNAGAERVYAIDSDAVLGLARKISEANGLHDRIHYIRGLSTNVELPEKVDVVVADQLGPFGIEGGGIVRAFSDARARFLKPSGKLIPSNIDLIVAPVESPALAGKLQFWNSRPAGMDFSSVYPLAISTVYTVHLSPAELLGSPVQLAALDCASVSPGFLKMQSEAISSRSGTLHGIGGWFSARLSPNVVVTNSPLEAEALQREQVFLPIERPVELETGDLVRIKLQITGTESVMTWTVEIWNGGTPAGQPSCKARFRHSTFARVVSDAEDLRRISPEIRKGSSSL